MDEDNSRFEYLHEQSKKFTTVMGLPNDLLLQIYKVGTDWEFILKIDALLEAATKQVIKKHLIGTQLMDKSQLEDFIEALPIRGRTSLLTLLKATKCPPDLVALIECVRRVRNGFAHDIKQVNSRLLNVITARNDKTDLLRGFSAVEKYDEQKLIQMYEADGRISEKRQDSNHFMH